MTFYEAMQLGANRLKPLIQETTDEKLKRKYTIAFVVKNFLCLLFCMVIVTTFSVVFGTENSIVGVVTVIALMTFRFSHLDFKVGQSTFALLGIFGIFIISPYIVTIVNPILGLIINFISIMTIVILSCHNVMMANQSTLVLSYLLLYGYRVSNVDNYVNRIFALILGGIIVSTIFYFKHRKMSFKNSFSEIIRDIDFTTERSKWQLKLSLGISTAILIGELLHIPRVMWIGFSCMSVLQPSKEKMEFRVKTRPIYMILGCIIFGVIYFVLPEQFRGYMGMIGGFMVGFSATYQWQTSFNCFGALTAAVPMFGIGWAIIIRIVDNFLGAIYSKIFDKIFDKVHENIFISNSINEAS